MSNGLLYILLLIPAIVLHELAHGVVARWLGDDTAQAQGRLTLNPLKHVDRFGSILLPGILAVGQIATLGHVQFLYGWAKPVPVNALNLQLHGTKNPRRLMVLVAIAGPAANFALALLGGLALHAGLFIAPLVFFIEINLLLGLFNLIPLPPMDGGRIAVGLLPLPLAVQLAKTERLGILLVLGGLFILPLVLQQFGVNFDPFGAAVDKILPQALSIILRLTGNDFGN